MDIDSIRRHCLSFPDTRENLQWGETLCFKVGKKIFAMVSLDVASETRLTFKCSPEGFAELLEHEGVRPAPYVGRYQWIALESLDALPDRQIGDLIQRSYEIIARKTKRVGRSPQRRRK